MGVLCARGKATGGVREAVRGAGRGIVWMCVGEGGEGGGGNGGGDKGEGEGGKGDGGKGGWGRVKQVLWNRRVAEMVGGEVGVGVRYAPGGKGIKKELCLLYGGRVWEPGGGGVVEQGGVCVDGG